MKINKAKCYAIAGILVLSSMLMASALPAFAQTSTTTVNQTSTSTTYTTTYSTTSTSTSSTSSPQTTTTTGTTTSTITGTSNANISTQIALLQAQVVILMGRVVANISAQATGTPELAAPIRGLQAAWVGYALSLLSNIRARFGL